MGDLLDLVRRLGLDTPEAWNPTVPPPATVAPDFRARNQFDPMTGDPVVAAPTDIVLPHEEPLTGWRGAVDTGLNALVGTVKGFTGLGEQGEAGPTWTNFGALAAAVPMGIPETFFGAIAKKLPRFAEALRTYRAPTEAGRLAAPFYSRLDEAAAALPGTFGAGKLATGTVSTEELIARGVPEFLAAQGTKPIAKAALTEHLAAHPVPGVAVKTLGEPAPPPRVVHTSTLEARPDYAGPSADVSPWATVDARTGEPYSFHQTSANAHDYIREFGADAPAPRPTKFSQYQLPGGTNYRETLITLPPQSALTFEDYAKDYRLFNPGAPDEAARKAYNRFLLGDPHARPPDVNAFKSSHFDEPNILAHTRSNEREIPGLGKGTFLEEVQSDWHQKGKAEGYQAPAAEQAARREEYNELARQSNAAEAKWAQLQRDPHAKGRPDSPERAAYLAAAGEVDRLRDAKAKIMATFTGGVPDAPFKESWPDLALKHHLAEAAQNPDTQWIGFTSGQTQAARYDLSKQISRLEYLPKSGPRLGAVRAYDKQGKMVLDKLAEPGELPDMVGKEATERLLAAAPRTGTGAGRAVHVLEGVDLQVGGEGMHHFYDQLLPKRLEKIVKPYGGTVERAGVPKPRKVFERDRGGWYVEMADGPADGPFPTRAAAEAHWPPAEEPAWILRLTPELKQRILRYGLPLLTGVAAVEAGRELDPSVFPAQEAS